MLVCVGDESERLGSYNDYYDFRAWVAHHVAKGEVLEFTESGVSIYHWDRRSEQTFPHLLIHQECGQYLPIKNIDPQPRIGSSVHLLDELKKIEPYRVLMPIELQKVFDVLKRMTKLSVDEFKIMEFSSIVISQEWRWTDV